MKLQKEIDLSWISLYEQYKKDYFHKNKFHFCEDNLIFIIGHATHRLKHMKLITEEQLLNILDLDSDMSIPIIDSYINEIKIK